MKLKVIVAKSFNQYIEEEFKKSPEFKKAYDKELKKLQAGFKIARLKKSGAK